MSWDIFKKTVSAAMQNTPTSYDQVASVIAMQYDMAIRSPNSGDFTAGNTVIKSNHTALEYWIREQFRVQSLTPSSLPIINMISYGFVLYWTDAKLSLAKTPLVCPIPGGVNISLVSNDVIFPGTPPVVNYPVGGTATTEQFVDYLIIAAQTHLQTVSGVMQIAWIYPTVPPGGGIVPMPWAGYKVPLPMPNPPVAITGNVPFV